MPVVAFSEADTPPKAGAARKSGAQLTAVARKKETLGCSKTCGGGPRPDHSATTRSAQVSEEPALDEKRMRNILKGFGEYPEKYRCVLLFVLVQYSACVRTVAAYIYMYVSTYVHTVHIMYTTYHVSM